MNRLAAISVAHLLEAASLHLVATGPSPAADGMVPAPAQALHPAWVGAIPLDARTGPTRAELEAIEAEWPVIAAEVALVDAECRHLVRPSAATRAAVRAAEAAVARAHLSFHTSPISNGAQP